MTRNHEAHPSHADPHPSRAPLLLDDGATDPSPWARVVAGGAALMAAVGLGALLLQAPDRDPVLPELVASHLADSGVSNPVTAVLLNFRSYDTLLEIAVLVVALMAVWSMDRRNRALTREESRLADPVLGSLARIVAPTAVVTAIYLTWAGTSDTGGAFQAGALLAGAGVFLAAAGFIRPPTAAWEPIRLTAAIGVYAFAVLGFGVIPWTGVFLQYPPGAAYPLIVAIEAVLMVSIAVVLVELFVDVPAVPDPDPRLDGVDPTGDPLGRLFDPAPVAGAAPPDEAADRGQPGGDPADGGA